jgi:hypothetical protein
MNPLIIIPAISLIDKLISKVEPVVRKPEVLDGKKTLIGAALVALVAPFVGLESERLAELLSLIGQGLVALGLLCKAIKARVESTKRKK